MADDAVEAEGLLAGVDLVAGNTLALAPGPVGFGASLVALVWTKDVKSAGRKDLPPEGGNSPADEDALFRDSKNCEDNETICEQEQRILG